VIAPRLIVALAIAASAVPAVAAAAGAQPPSNARVIGTFTMRAQITAAVNVPGERPGEVLTRRWVIVPRSCDRNTCRSLELARQRSDRLVNRVLLQRIGPGRYTGQGAFWVALECKGRIDPVGSEALYQITLQVARATRIGGVWFARQIRASYVNRTRSDGTSCPLGPTHDAATYSGSVTAGLPTAPVASFKARIHKKTGRVRFRGTSKPGRGNGRIVSRLWWFGDPRSGPTNISTRARPKHRYTRPGRYRVRLRVVTADGLSATHTRTIVIRRRPPQT
jgi:hypothetical protein